MRTLHLTTPPMRGDDVEQAQRRLKGSNVLRQNFAPGALDGVYGPATMRAAKRAKFWAGYPTSKIDGAYGDELHAYLGGKTLPLANQLRRRSRLAAIPAKPLRVAALEQARTHVGTKENPAGSNRVMFSAWYGLVGPWCAMFTTYCYSTVGSTAAKRGERWAYVPYLVNDARAGRNNVAVTHDPKPGDLAAFDWDGDGLADHVGFFEGWVAGSADTFSTVEGNTAVGNDSNGGEVMRRQRNRRDVQAFIHVAR